MTTLPEAIPAATIVLMRAPPGGAPGLPPEILMVERAGQMRFAGGAMVFPGGRVDPGDRVLAARFADADPDDAAARVAAIRETIEEVGVAIGIVPAPDADAIAAIRAGLAAGEAFGALLAARAMILDPSAMIAFARWWPAHRATRAFDTRFYAAAVSADTIAIADGGECVRALWITAADALAQSEAGALSLIFPTRCALDRIAAHAGFDAFANDAASRAIATITPWTETRDGIDWLCIPEDQGYPVTAMPVDRVRRG